LADLVAKLIFPRPEHAASFIQRFIWVAKKSIFNFLLGFGFFFIFGTLYVTIGNKAGLSVGFLDRLHLAFFSPIPRLAGSILGITWFLGSILQEFRYLIGGNKS
jgi:hypothetical protein